MGVRFYRLHTDQSELLDLLCYYLRISHSFLFGSSPLIALPNYFNIRNKNKSQRITSLSNRTLLQSLKTNNSNLGKS